MSMSQTPSARALAAVCGGRGGSLGRFSGDLGMRMGIGEREVAEHQRHPGPADGFGLSNGK